MEERLPDQNTEPVNEGDALLSADASEVAENEAQTVATDDAGRIALAAYTPNEDYYTETIFLQTLRKRRVLKLGGILLVLLSGIQMTRNAPDYRDVHNRARAQCPKNDVLLRMESGLLFLELPVTHHLRDKRMVLRNLMDGIVYNI